MEKLSMKSNRKGIHQIDVSPLFYLNINSITEKNPIAHIIGFTCDNFPLNTHTSMYEINPKDIPIEIL